MVLLLAASVIGHVASTTMNNNINMNTQNIQEAPRIQSISEKNVSHTPWKGLRVFADTSMLEADTEACNRVGKYVRVGKPQGDQVPVCSSSIINDCWKLCEERDVLTSEKAKYITDIMVPVVNWFLSVVKVERSSSRIYIPQSAVPAGCAAHLSLPLYYHSSGFSNTDLVLIVTGRPTPTNTVAWATECAADQSGRPVFGHINIGPGELEDFEFQKQYIYKVLLHELTHVIGFNSYKFPYYKDSTGKPYKNVIKTQVINGKKISKIITPRVLAEARDHFGCPEMDGVPLEDGGDWTTSDSHWEKRLFKNEYMTGSSDHTAVISKISLALLEDTGFYKVEYEHAEHFEWGRGMGCSFVNGRCSDWENRKGYFCTQPGTKGCTVDRSAMGYCNLIRHRSELPTPVRYFADSHFGGSDALADYCPHVAAYANGVCSDSRNQPEDAAFGESFGENSKCFESSLVQDGRWKKPDIQPMCYDFRCIEEEEGMKLEVSVNGSWHYCPFDGQIVNVSGFSGSLHCPSSSFCHERKINTKNYETLNVEGSSSSISPLLFVLLCFQFYLLLL